MRRPTDASDGPATEPELLEAVEPVGRATVTVPPIPIPGSCQESMVIWTEFIGANLLTESSTVLGMVTHSSRSEVASSRFPGGGGSRRDDAAHDRVIAATLELLGEVGYGNLSIEAVAARAAVGKPLIYRWWNNKAHLAYDACVVTATAVTMADTGDFVTDLRRFVERVAKFLWRDEVTAALRGMLADPSVSHALQDDHVGPARRHLRAVVATGVKTGEVAPEVDADALFDLAVGAIMLRALSPTKPPRSRRRASEGIVDLLLRAARS